MKATRSLNTRMEVLDGFIQQLADQDAGQPATAGLCYRKSVMGMNGRSQSVTLTIQALESGLYSVLFENSRQVLEMTYRYHPVDREHVELVYEETDRSSGTVSKLNQKLSGILFSKSTKKQAAMRLDLFERQLEAYAQCQD